MKLRELLIHFNEENLKIIYNEYRKPIFLFIFSIVKNKETAEDLTEEVFIRIIKYHHTYKPIYNPKTWIFQIAKNISYTHLKNQKEVSISNEKLIPILDKEYATTLDQSWLIREYLSKLKERDRNIIILHIFGGLKHHEISKILNLKSGTIRFHYRKAINQLKKELTHEENRK